MGDPFNIMIAAMGVIAAIGIAIGWYRTRRMNRQWAEFDAEIDESFRQHAKEKIAARKEPTP